MNQVLFIAECGHNHNGNIPLAKALIWTAKACGADMAKFQVYDTDTLKLNEEEKQKGIYSDLKQGELTRDQLWELKKECDRAKIEFFASAFDIKRISWLEEIEIKRHKIASRMIHDKAFIEAIEKTGKPIIASLGWWNKQELPDIKGKVDYLYCVAKYPPTDEEMRGMPKKFRKYSGFSDHTIGIRWTQKAIKRGAKIIEKHFTIDRDMFGCDQKGSIEPFEFKKLIQWTRKLTI